MDHQQPNTDLLMCRSCHRLFFFSSFVQTGQGWAIATVVVIAVAFLLVITTTAVVVVVAIVVIIQLRQVSGTLLWLLRTNLLSSFRFSLGVLSNNVDSI